MKPERELTKYEDKYIKANRTFPVGNTVLLVLIVLIQIGMVIVGIWYQPQPQDLIHRYDVTVQPREDGSLDIEYHLVWEALDPLQELTWVEIGMANPYFTITEVSSNIKSARNDSDDGYAFARLDFEEAYRNGDVVEFSFKVHQQGMLCKNDTGYFYEFVPGWFNSIQVEQYEFRWLLEDAEDYVRQGSLDFGAYCKMTVQYGPDDFTGCQTFKYSSFDDSGAYNALAESRMGIIAMCAIFFLLLVAAEVYIVDCYVSYGRGRGFLTGHGYHIHTYGRSNPYYIRARDKYNAKHSGRARGYGGGRSCACACACACAGGGRAGCSQKDTYAVMPRHREN